MSAALALAPFRTRSFRFQWPADLCTAWALEMETLILGWYILVETGSVVMLTVFGSLQFIGTLVSPMLGMLGDRLGLRNVLAAMRACYALLAAVILFLALTRQLDPVAVLIVAALCGLVRPSDIGLRSALVGATVPPAHLVAAIGVSQTTQDSAKVGGALAGAGFMAAFGMAPAYLLITSLYTVGALLTLRTAAGARAPAPAADRESGDSSPRPARPSPWRELKAGITYAWRTPRLLAAVTLAALVNLTAFPFTVGLMPYIARDVFHLDQHGLGWLVACFAGGALLGSVALSLFGARVRSARVLIGATLIWHLCLIGFIGSSSLPVAMAMLVAAGFAQCLSMLTLALLILRTADEQFRGRIMGVRMLAIYTLPVGLLICGALIPRIGFTTTAMSLVALGGVLTLVIAWCWRQDLLAANAVGNVIFVPGANRHD